MLKNQLTNTDPHRLPLHLGERLCRLSSHGLRCEGEFVVYWMRVALRAHENPALDVAAHLAATLGLPLLVLQVLEDEGQFASDRLHTFALESFRDAQHELAERGIAFALHLRESHGDLSAWPVFQRAALIVTDEMPVNPYRSTASELIAYHPACTVDSSCIVPMSLTTRAPERAFAFRKETKSLRDARLGLDWTNVEPPQSELPANLGFDSVDLRSLGSAAIAEIVAGREVDHLVGPVRDTPGGSTAGYFRWNRFVRTGLTSYARRRNDPLQTDGVSRMSAYLHLGCVSPFRLAREAAIAGAKKYLDELLLWREVAWHFCFHTDEVDEYEALPEWARKTLDTHADDRREKPLSWESLARAESGDLLWDTAQRSLLRHGELHNNVRMTWGKAFLDWTDTPREALRLALDINHRYALDGRDPASYGGVLWCFGLFDRPFTPELPIRGTVRPREVTRHAERLDVEEWAEHINRCSFSPTRVAVVGGGIAGLTCARALQDHGLEVVLFDKARGPGGRLSSRRSEVGIFDHGAQYFTAFDHRFARYVESWESDRVVASWVGRFATIAQGRKPLIDPSSRQRYSGRPRMSAVTRRLGSALRNTHYGVRVTSAERLDEKWGISGEDTDGNPLELGQFDQLVLALPAPQAHELLTSAGEFSGADEVLGSLERAVLEPCWSVMVHFAAPFEPGFDAARVENSPLAWVARESSKPGREPGERWVLQASPAWSRAHMEHTNEDVSDQLVETFRTLVESPDVTFQRAHRWRFARVSEDVGEACLLARGSGLVACGDWCIGPRVGAAWLSGAAAAGRLLGQLPGPNAEALKPGSSRAHGQSS